MTDIEIIIEAQAAQLANPTRAVVNGECAFVKDRILFEYKRPELARDYWNWVCSKADNGCLMYGKLVLDQYRALREIDSRSVMPEWGWKGT